MLLQHEIVGTYEVAGISCQLVVGDEGLWELLASRYAAFSCDAIPEVTIHVEVTAPPPDAESSRRAGPFARIGGRDAMLTIEGTGFQGAFDEPSGQGWIMQPPDPTPLETFLTAICAGRLLKKEGFLLHAAAVLADEGVQVFFGPSGSGKTTVAESVGAGVITDEIVAIRRTDERYRVSAVPWRGSRLGAPLAPPLAGLFRLRHARETEFTRLSPAETVRHLLPCVFLPRADASEVERFLETGGELVRRVPCYEMRFSPDGSFWDVLPGRRAEEMHGLAL